MSVIAALMDANDDDARENENDLRLMRAIAARMKSRPLSMTSEDDRDLQILRDIHDRMTARKQRIERRVEKIAAQRKTVRKIVRLAA